MAKLTPPAEAAKTLFVRERMILFCVASGTDWLRVGGSGEAVTGMAIKRLVLRDAAGVLTLTDCGSVVLRAMLLDFMKLNSDQRRILEMLAGGGPRGCAEAALRAHGFDAAMLAELVDAGLASRLPEQVRAGGRSVDVCRYKITDYGRTALA